MFLMEGLQEELSLMALGLLDFQDLVGIQDYLAIVASQAQEFQDFQAQEFQDFQDLE